MVEEDLIVPARQRIMVAASELFLPSGTRAVGVDAVIERARVAKATFYRHFPSKDDLLMAWLRDADARWLDEVAAELQRRGLDPLRTLTEFWDVLADWSERRRFCGCPHLNCLIEIGDVDHPVRAEVEAYVREVERFLERTARAAGLARPLDWALRQRTLVMGAFVAAELERSRAPMERAKKMTTDLLVTWDRGGTG